MESALISIRKEHNDKIINGEKQWDGRKTIPKELAKVANVGQLVDQIEFFVYEPKAGGGCGKVRYQFISHGAYKFNPKAQSEYEWCKIAKALCVSVDWAKTYYNGDKGYLISVECPKIYDKPKELSEFKLPCSSKQCASYCCDMNLDSTGTLKCLNKNKRFMKRPPQSWCYVER